ncbi:hypothetical protein ZIOFF_016858 [Zingiber officinale]|uniref:F-box domain-containing protein n=1 Tax=Zingiber officinale TaxID=94328 RepID=A0A8J5HGY5_ZINOF|nr:hypothetical protein ZIOFF_016858 [Zingiber officinale]
MPTECIAHVLSFTTPRDVCRASLVDKTFLAAVETDALWECFPPSDRVEILSRAVDPVEYASNKELYFRLYNPILVDQAKMICSSGRTFGCLLATYLWLDRQSTLV